MPIESPEDRATFLDADEFGEWIVFTPAAGPSPIRTTALWDRPTTDVRFGEGEVRIDTHAFTLACDAVPEPIPGDFIVVERTGQTFNVAGEPASTDGGFWVCEANPLPAY